jgi:CO/xanthine dehydrogenase Mo-binding subunit
MKADNFKIIGIPVNRVDGVDKVTGQAKYVGDIAVPGMAEGKFLRSPYAHARILSIDTAEAEQFPGVIAVLTAKDLGDVHLYMGRKDRKDQPIIAVDRALYAGQPVAAVAAVDAFTAEEALSKIRVEYQELPAVISVPEAVADGAPQIHSFAPKNICFQDELIKGDIEKGFAESEEIFEDTFEFPMVYHYSMEPHTTIAKVDSEGITVWSSNTHPFGIRQELAEIFGC